VVPVLSITVLVVLAAGVWQFTRKSGAWARRSVEAQLWGWLVVLTTAGGTLVVAVLQRPRPAYIYPLTFLVMALVGLSVALIVGRLPGWRGQRLLVPLAMMAVVALAPRYYDDPLHVRPQTVLAHYESLRPHGDLIRNPATVFLMGDYVHEIAIYLGADRGQTRPYAILDGYRGAERLDEYLANRGVTVFYVDKAMHDRLQAIESARPLLSDPGSVGWVLLGRQNLGQSSWLLLARSTSR